MESCLEQSELEVLARASGAGPVAARAHVAGCERCRTRLVHIERDEALFVELREAARDSRATGGASNGAVPGYTLERELRRGGQGVVHAARQDATRRACAVKLLDGVRTARERRRFEIEIELACRLRHPFIVTVYDSGVARGVPWFAMELVEGRPLDEWVRETQPALRARLELFARIASAVAYAHRRGVIHRDLKPANMLVDSESRPRILDFGAALDAGASERSLRLTAPGEFLGTLAYAAPEQLSGDGSEVDTRTDVHALGLVLYELVCGRMPYEVAGSVSEIVRIVTTEAAPPPSRFAPGLDRDLDAIALTALEKDPARRYASVAALGRDVELHLAGLPIQARPSSAWYRARKLVARHRGAFAACALVLAVGSSSFVAWSREHQRAERQREQVALVSAVFQDILSAASRRMGGDARLLEVFEIAGRTIDESLRDAPDVQGAMELTIGDTYRKLLRSGEAVPHLRRALERYSAAPAAGLLDVARCANLLGLALSDLNLSEAVQVQERALAIRARALPDGHPLVAESERNLAIALLSQFKDVDVPRATGLLDRAERAFLAAHGPDDPELAETRLWRIHTVPKQDGQRIGELLSAAEQGFARSAPEDPRLIAVLNEQAAWAQHHGAFDEAGKLLDRAAELTRKLYGDALATDLLRRYARLAFARGDTATAERMSRQALAGELLRWSAKRPESGSRLRAIAQRIEQPGAPSLEPPWAEAFAALRELEGNGSFELAQWINGITVALVAEGRGSAALPMLREALQIHCRAMGGDCPVRQQTIDLYAGLLLAGGRGDQALPELEESLETYARTGQAESPQAAHTAELLAACRECAGR